MKIFFFALGIVLFFVATSPAKTITLTWGTSPSTNVTGYKVYYGQTPAPPFVGANAAEGASPIDVGNVLTYTLTNIPNGETTYIGITAYNALGLESDYSNIVVSNGIEVPLAPANLTGVTLSTILNISVPLTDYMVGAPK
jgi:hypothetical protein